jgi:hypothetical protein
MDYIHKDMHRPSKLEQAINSKMILGSDWFIILKKNHLHFLMKLQKKNCKWKFLKKNNIVTIILMPFCTKRLFI